VQHLRDFGRFEMNKRDLSRQREDSSQNPRALLPAVILINVWVGIVEHHLVDPCVLPPPHYVQNIAQEIRKNRGILNLNRVQLSWTQQAFWATSFMFHFILFSQLQSLHFVV
jgi:ABC-type nitrate/sulfonate/bicarbonate transport system permease component